MSITKRNASTALMPPPPAPKRIKRPNVVLDEDTYVSAVSHIIRRDFFPGLAEADAQREYLNAVESNDKSWIREAGKKLTQAMTPVPSGKRRVSERTRFSKASGSTEKTPSVWGADTPTTVAPSEAEDDEEEGLGKLDSVDLSMGLNAFQAKYTSEDQESFSQLIDAQNAKKFARTPWLREGNMYASKQRLAQQKVIQARAPSTDTQLVLSTQDTRQAAPKMHAHTPFNTLMFAPDSIESWAPTRATTAQSASLAPPKQVLYNNTRLPAPDTEPQRPPSPTLSSIRAAVSGRPRLNPSEAGYNGSETPRVNGYAFVDAAPDLDSDDDDDDAPTDLLERYGLDKAGAGSATPFSMADSSHREKMAHKMAERIGARRSNPNNNSGNEMKKKVPGSGLGIFSSETPRFMSAPTPVRGNQTPGGRKVKGDLTPAAQRLYERMGKTPGRRSGFGGREEGGSGLGREWTPSSRVMKRKI